MDLNDFVIGQSASPSSIWISSCIIDIRNIKITTDTHNIATKEMYESIRIRSASGEWFKCGSRKLGDGSYAAVYPFVDANNARRCAVKINVLTDPRRLKDINMLGNPAITRSFAGISDCEFILTKLFVVQNNHLSNNTIVDILIQVMELGTASAASDDCILNNTDNNDKYLQYSLRTAECAIEAFVNMPDAKMDNVICVNLPRGILFRAVDLDGMTSYNMVAHVNLQPPLLVCKHTPLQVTNPIIRNWAILARPAMAPVQTFYASLVSHIIKLDDDRSREVMNPHATHGLIETALSNHHFDTHSPSWDDSVAHPNHPFYWIAFKGKLPPSITHQTPQGSRARTISFPPFFSKEIKDIYQSIMDEVQRDIVGVAMSTFFTEELARYHTGQITRTQFGPAYDEEKRKMYAHRDNVLYAITDIEEVRFPQPSRAIPVSRRNIQVGKR